MSAGRGYAFYSSQPSNQPAVNNNYHSSQTQPVTSGYYSQPTSNGYSSSQAMPSNTGVFSSSNRNNNNPRPNDYYSQTQPDCGCGIL